MLGHSQHTLALDRFFSIPAVFCRQDCEYVALYSRFYPSFPPLCLQYYGEAFGHGASFLSITGEVYCLCI